MSYSKESRPALKFAFKVNFEFYGSLLTVWTVNSYSDKVSSGWKYVVEHHLGNLVYGLLICSLGGSYITEV